MRLQEFYSWPMQANRQAHCYPETARLTPCNADLEAPKCQCNARLAAILMLCGRTGAYHRELAACEEVLGLASHDGGQLEQRGQRQAARRHRHQQRALACLHGHPCSHPKHPSCMPKPALKAALPGVSSAGMGSPCSTAPWLCTMCGRSRRSRVTRHEGMQASGFLGVAARPRTCPSRPQHCRENSRAASDHSEGAMRSA